MLGSIAFIILAGLCGSLLFKKIKLPGLIGMLLAGIIIGPGFLNILDDSILNISAYIRKIALIIILSRAGLGLDLDSLKKNGRPAFLLSFVPAAFELIVITIIGPVLFNISYIEAAILGTVLAAVSPAVIVPRMLKLKEEGYRDIPEMILAGASAYPRKIDFQKFREIADEVGALLMIDMAHPAGLIAAGLLDNPVKYAHIVTTTTHKSLRGPRGGVILMGKDFENPWGKKTPKGQIKMMSQLLNSAVFPGTQGGPLEHVIAAKAVAFGEALQPEFKEYATQVKKNAAVLADELVKRGFDIVSGGTDNHSMLVDLRNKYPELTGKVAENALVAADITCNKNMVPFDTRSAFQTSGIRLGTPAITTRGAKEDLMVLIAELIEEVLNDPENEQVIANVRKKVNETMKNYPLFAY